MHVAATVGAGMSSVCMQPCPRFSRCSFRNGNSWVTAGSMRQPSAGVSARCGLWVCAAFHPPPAAAQTLSVHICISSMHAADLPLPGPRQATADAKAGPHSMRRKITAAPVQVGVSPAAPSSHSSLCRRRSSRCCMSATRCTTSCCRTPSRPRRCRAPRPRSRSSSPPPRCTPRASATRWTPRPLPPVRPMHRAQRVS